MDKKNNDEKTFGEIFSNINTSNNDDKSISFNSIKEESNLEDSELKSEDLFKEASHSDDNNDSNNMTFNSIFDDDNSSSDDNVNVSDSSLEKSSSIFDKAIHDDDESDSGLISDNGDSKNESVADNDNSLDVEEDGLDVNPFFNNDSSNDGGLENKIDGNSNKDDKEIADGDKVDDNVTTDLEEDTKVKDSGNDNNLSFSEDNDEVEEVNPFFDNSSSNDEVSKEESSDNSSNIFFGSDDSSENKVDDNVTTDLEEAAEVKDSGNDNNSSFSEDKDEVEEVNPFFDNSSSNDEVSKEESSDNSSNIFFGSDDSSENKVDDNVTTDLEEAAEVKDSGNDNNPSFSEDKNEVEEVNPFFDNDNTNDKVLEDEPNDGSNNIKDSVAGARANVVKVSIDDDDNLILEEESSLDKTVNFSNNDNIINDKVSNDNLFQNTDISNLDNNSSSDKKDNDLDVSPFFADTSNSNKKEDVNPFFDNKINLVESTSHDVSDTASKIDTSKVHNFNVKVVKKKEPIIKFILGVLSYAVFIWLLLIGITLLVYVLDIKIRAAKGDTSPPKFNAFVVLSGSMLPEIQVYDVVITKKVDAKSLKEGDVITFASSDTRFLNTIITHRIIKKNYDSKTGGYTFQTQGDNNNVADSALVQPNNIYGKVILKIPKLGYLQEFLASDGGWILVILLPCLIVISYDIVKLSKKLRGKKYKNIKVQSR